MLENKIIISIFFSFTIRINKNSNFDCPFDDNGEPDMSDPRAWHRLYDEYYEHEEDEDEDEDDSFVDGQNVIDDYMVNLTKFRWSQYGKSIPDNFVNPFEIYDD